MSKFLHMGRWKNSVFHRKIKQALERFGRFKIFDGGT